MQLSKKYTEREARQVAEIIFENSGLKKTSIYNEPEKCISSDTVKKLEKMLAELMKGKPVQYVTGKAFFLDLELQVNESVLIPRPETEELVSIAEKLIREKGMNNQQFSVLDIGTGSGCIAIAIKNIFPKAKVTAVDVSTDALNLARKNADKYQLEIDFVQNNFLTEHHFVGEGKWDVIISNPPYVHLNDRKFMDGGVLDYEPHLALFPEGDDVLVFYRKISAFALQTLEANGFVFVEIHEDLGNEVKKIFESNQLNPIKLIQDLQGKDRFVMVEKK